MLIFVIFLCAHVGAPSVKKLDDDEMKCADINGDGKVNVSDISLLAAYVKGIKPLG